VVAADAMRVDRVPGPPPTALVANLPYNVSVPVLLHLLTLLPSLERGLVMVQAEVADRLAAPPGSKVYGVPSVKAAWFADVRRAGAVGRNVFWPAPERRLRAGGLDPPRAAATTATGGGVRGRRCGVRASAADAAGCAVRLAGSAPRPRPRYGPRASTRRAGRGADVNGVRPGSRRPCRGARMTFTVRARPRSTSTSATRPRKDGFHTR
jgi:hypothetical protein